MHHRFTDVESPCTCTGEAIGYALDQDLRGLILCMCGQPNLQAYQCIGCQRPDSMPHALTSAERRGTRYRLGLVYPFPFFPSRGRGGAGRGVVGQKAANNATQSVSQIYQAAALAHGPLETSKTT